MADCDSEIPVVAWTKARAAEWAEETFSASVAEAFTGKV